MNAKTVFVLMLLVLAVAADFSDDIYYKYRYLNDTALAGATEGVSDSVKDPNEFGFMESCQPTQGAVSTGVELIRNSFFALVIVAMAVALMYMAGTFFQLPTVSAIARQEINEMLMTVLVALVFSSFLAGSAFSQALFGFDVFQEATNYSYKMLYKVGSVSSVMITANIALNSIYTLFIPFGPVRKAVTIQLGPVLRPLIDGVSFSLQFLITTYGEWVVFVFMFCFVQKWFLPFFFPAGLFLRSFSPTRGAGNTLIALSVALSTIYPLMFYIDSLIFEKQFAGQMMSFDYFEGAVKAIYAQLSLGGVAALFGVLSFIYVTPVMVGAILMTTYLFFDTAMDVLHLVVMFSILLPVLNIFMTISFAREIAQLLGTEINLGAFAKLI